MSANASAAVAATDPAQPDAPQLSQALGYAVADKRMDILRGIVAGGSISQAARVAGVSYKAAWQAIDTLSNLAGTALLSRSVGGAGGGGASLTPDGLRLLALADELEQARQEVLARHAARLDSSAPGHQSQRVGAALGLRMSMRNQLAACVGSLRREGALVHAHLVLPGGGALAASLTQESAQLLGLVAGLDLVALCKATAVRVQAQNDGVESQSGLAGQVQRVAKAGAAQEVVIALGGGQQLVGFTQPGSSPLRKGQAVQGWVEPSAVVVALI
jgi:molybdate transport system regulatory protein